MDDDGDTLERLRSGDASAFASLVRRLQRSMVGVAMGFVGNRRWKSVDDASLISPCHRRYRSPEFSHANAARRHTGARVSMELL